MKPRIAVLGDLILDHTITVEAGKIAQEAPIIAYKVLGESYRNGGAGAVNDMAIALGVQSQLVFIRSINNAPVSRKVRLVSAGSRNPTIVARFDADAEFEWTDEFRAALRHGLPKYGPDVVIISDYGKGMVDADLVREVRFLLGNRVTILVDPYTSDWSKYEGADIILPSRAALSHDFKRDGDLCGFACVVPKLDKDGCGVYGAGPMELFPTQARNVLDVTGAGDQFIATLAAHIGTGVSLKRAAWLANLAAGMQCERIGIVAVTAEELKCRADQVDEMELSAVR